MDLEMYSFLQKHAHPKTVERYMLSRGVRVLLPSSNFFGNN
jgi:hypothetical protein